MIRSNPLRLAGSILLTAGAFGFAGCDTPDATPTPVTPAVNPGPPVKETVGEKVKDAEKVAGEKIKAAEKAVEEKAAEAKKAMAEEAAKLKEQAGKVEKKVEDAAGKAEKAIGDTVKKVEDKVEGKTGTTPPPAPK